MATGNAPEHSEGRGLTRKPPDYQRLLQPPEARFFRYREIVPKFAAFCRSLYAALPTHLRVNTLKASATEIRAGLERRGLSVAPGDQTGPLLVE